jgi:hypothetical protein
MKIDMIYVPVQLWRRLSAAFWISTSVFFSINLPWQKLQLSGNILIHIFWIAQIVFVWKEISGKSDKD